MNNSSRMAVVWFLIGTEIITLLDVVHGTPFRSMYKISYIDSTGKRKIRGSDPVEMYKKFTELFDDPDSWTTEYIHSEDISEELVDSKYLLKITDHIGKHEMRAPSLNVLRQLYENHVNSIEFKSMRDEIKASLGKDCSNKSIFRGFC